MLFRLHALLCVFSLISGVFSQAYAGPQKEDIFNLKGEKLFELRFFKPGDGEFAPPSVPPSPFSEPKGEVADRPFTRQQKHAIRNVFTYYAHVIRPPSYSVGQSIAQFFKDPMAPAHTVINLGQANFNNALGKGATNLVAPRKSLHNYDAHAYLILGDVFAPQDSAHIFSPLVSSAKGADLFSVAVHEFAHTLFGSKQGNSQYFVGPLTPFEQGLHDGRGKKAQPTMEIQYSEGECGSNPLCFVKAGATFQGSHITEVLQGTFPDVVNEERSDICPDPKASGPLKGVPINRDFLHLELRNGLMSHQSFRNYSSLMEVELALLQDIGFKVNRRNFFGYSVYQNYREIVNSSPFPHRNSGGTEYYSITPLGIGLHVYGSHNKITQIGHILTTGPGAVGIRIDGESNKIIIPSHTKIHADGINGRGILVAYGTNHQINLDGEIRAAGERGIGASFDFGGTIIGTNAGWDVRSYATKSFLNDPLVETFNITGHLEGTLAALFIAQNAHVNQINVMRGAQIVGDMISYYKRERSPNPHATTASKIIFGAKPNGLGEATTMPDPDFFITYNGAIRGIHNLRLIFRGGMTELTQNKSHEILDLVIEPSATLRINGHVDIERDWGGAFRNQGTLEPTNFPRAGFGRVIIDGDYRQMPEGRLKIAFDSKESASLSTPWTAFLNGELFLEAKPDFYPEGWICPTPFLEARAIVGNFTFMRTNSPTLEFTTFRSSHESYQTLHINKPARFENREASDQIVPQTNATTRSANTNETIQHPESSPGEIDIRNTPELNRRARKEFHASEFAFSPQNMDQETAEQNAHESTQHSEFSTVEPDTGTTPESQRKMRRDVSTEQAFSPEDLNRKREEVSDSEKQSVDEALQDTVRAGDHITSGFSRPWDAYSRYGADQNGQSVGHVLRRLVRSTSGDRALEELYKALDFSALDGSEIRFSLSQMTPSAYSAVFAADVGREQQISDAISVLPSWEQSSPLVWQAFAMPFGGRMQQDNTQDLRVPYTGTEAGVIFGIERRLSSQSRWLLGMHGLVSRGDFSIKTADAAHVNSMTMDWGMHTRYEERLDEGAFFTGQARVGFQSNTLKRHFSIGFYSGALAAQWTSWSTAAVLTGGYLFKLGDMLSLGPVLGLDMTTVYFPTLTENSVLLTALKLKDNSFYSTRGQFGLKGKLYMSQKFTLEAQAIWNQELLDKVLVQQAQFAAYPKTSFLTENSVLPGQTMTLQAQVTYIVTPYLMLTAQGTKILKSGINVSVGQITGMLRF